MSHVHRVACPLDCPDSCTLAVEVEGGRIQRIDSATDGALHPLQGGLICGKVRRMAEHVHGDERLRTPLLRRGPKGEGVFEPCTWDEALEHVAAQYADVARRHGPRALLPVSYGGSNGLLTQDAADALFFRRFGAAPVERTLCAAPSSSAQGALYGKMPGMSLVDMEHSQLVVLWGVNPHVSGIHLVPVVERALERGAKLVVVDPRATSFARRAHLHLQLEPGSDLPLALAIANLLFERGHADLAFLEQHARAVDRFREACAAWSPARAARATGVPVEQIEQFAELYGTRSPAAIRCGWGVERSRSGGMGTAAILALPAVAGHFGHRGAGFAMSAGSGAWRGQLADACDEPDVEGPAVNLSRLGEALAGGPDAAVFALHVYNANPLATFPNQERIRRGLLREDLFTVVHDAVLTDTALYADVVLPATTFFEHAELQRSYGAFALQLSTPAIPPVGESRSNHQVFVELARRLGLLRSGERTDEARFVEAALALRPQRLEVLRNEGLVAPDTGFQPVAFVDMFPGTADGRVDLWPAEFETAPGGPWHWQAEPPGGGGPLVLISPATSRTTSSTFGQRVRGPISLALHPFDADKRGLVEGQLVRAFNDLGEVHARLTLDSNLRPGVACLPKGLWARHTHNGRTANALIPDHLSDVGGGACYNDARCEVAALESSA